MNNIIFIFSFISSNRNCWTKLRNPSTNSDKILDGLFNIYLYFRAALPKLSQLRVAAATILTKTIEFVVLSFLSIYYIAEALIQSLTPPFLRHEKNLEGKVVLVTGGAGGVGQELALRLAREGAKVVIWDVNEKGRLWRDYE